MSKCIYQIIILSLILLSCNLNNTKVENSLPNKVVVNKELLSSENSTQTYLLLSNPSLLPTSIPKVKINGNTARSITPTNKKSTKFNDYVSPKRVYRNLKHSTSSNRTINNIDINYDSFYPGKVKNFNIWEHETSYSPGYLESNEYTLKSRTLVSITDDVELYIWTDNFIYNKNRTDYIGYNISDKKIDELSIFFKEMYSDMTLLYGKHWGEHENSERLNSNKKDIHILLTDLDHDKNRENEAGIFYGYFDNYDTKIVQDSNFCLNFVIDSFDLTNVEDTYSETLIKSTIIHEFQHMIHFYNKGLPNESECFINEMFSMVAEDILAEKYLKFFKYNTEYILRPDFSRVPLFNTTWNYNSIFYWNKRIDLESYSRSYVLGAFLIRKYGSELLKGYFSINSSGKTGLIETLQNINNSDNYSISDLIKNFGIAILETFKISNTTTKIYKSNGNNHFNYISELKIDEKVFTLYPIDFFNDYSNDNIDNTFDTLTLDQLNKLSTIETKTFIGESNIYIDLGEVNNSDNIEIDFLQLDNDIEYSLIY